MAVITASVRPIGRRSGFWSGQNRRRACPASSAALTCCLVFSPCADCYAVSSSLAGLGSHGHAVGCGRRDDPAAGKQLTHVVEGDNAVAQQAPPLLGVTRYHPCGHVIGCRCVWAAGLVFAHFPSWDCEVLLDRIRAGWESHRGRHERGWHHQQSARSMAASAPQAPKLSYRPAGKRPASQHHEPTAAGGDAAVGFRG
jgi:hypothetical protein